jgi:hypothetical protein
VHLSFPQFPGFADGLQSFGYRSPHLSLRNCTGGKVSVRNLTKNPNCAEPNIPQIIVVYIAFEGAPDASEGTSWFSHGQTL